MMMCISNCSLSHLKVSTYCSCDFQVLVQVIHVHVQCIVMYV